MRTRTSPRELERAALAAVRSAASALGFDVVSVPETAATDVVLTGPDGHRIAVEITSTSIATRELLVGVERRPGRLPLVVADQVSGVLRQQLNERGIGWLDRRGHLRLVGGGLFVDADVPAAPRRGTAVGSGRAPIAGRSGLAAASALLLQPDDPLGVSEIARRAGLNPSSITRAMGSIVDAQLAEHTSRGRFRPLVPELFWALADVWPRDRITISASIADVRAGRFDAHLDDAALEGWALGGARGAVAWGAPLVLTGDFPPLLLVPDDEALRVAAARFPRRSSNEGGEVWLAVDPTGLATTQRFALAGEPVPLAPPLFCALELAASARDREALDAWVAPDGFVRVW
jgi:hypothetical protein